MKRKIQVLFLAVLSAITFAFGFACKNEENGPSENFIIAHADIPDAYYGVSYDLNDIINKEEGVTYSVNSLYSKSGESKKDIDFSGMTFTPDVKNTYIYTVIKATKNDNSVLSEEVRIRALSSINYYLVDKADVRDAFVGSAYDLNTLIRQKQEGVSYSYSVYKLAEDGSTQVSVTVENNKFTATESNVYYYAVVTATKGNETDVSEPMRIRSMAFDIREDVLVADKYFPAATLNKSYNLDGLIHRQPGVTYTAIAYYKNGSEKIEIPVDNFKLVPTKAGENFFVVITASNGEKTVTCKEIEIEVEAEADARDKNFMDSWEDSAIVESLNSDLQYVKVGNTSIKYSYKGKRNYYYLCGSIPFTDLDEMDVTDWSNAVISFWVYNPNDYTLTLSQNLRHDASGIQKDHTFDSKYERVIAANGWTQVTYSLRALGITSKFVIAFVGGGDYWGLKIHSNQIPYSSVEGDTEIDYCYYIDDVNIYDYSKELFPDLETRTPEEIEKDDAESVIGDKLDKNIVESASNYQPLVYSAAIENTEKYGEDSTSSMKFTFTQPSSTVYGLANTLRGTMFLDDSNILYNACDGSKIDWSKAYIGFWVKSSVNCGDIMLKFATKSGTDWKGCTNFNFTTYWVGKLGGSNAEWKYLEMSLSDAAKDSRSGVVAFEYYTTNVTGFKFSICTEVNVGTGNTATFWIDGLSLYNKVESDDFDIFAVSNNVYKWDNYTAEINHDSANIKEGNSSIKYTYTYNKAYYEGRNSQFFYIQSDFSSDIFGMKADTFKTENLYVGFWYKQSAKLNDSLVFGVRLENAVDGSYAPDWSLDSGSWNCREVENDTEWQYVEFELYKGGNGINYPLAGYLNRDNVDQYRFSLFTICGENDNIATFYIDGLAIYTESKLA